MRIVCSRHIVGARLQDIGPGSLRIIGSKLRAVEAHAHGLALARIEKLGLGIADKHDRCLLDSLCPIVVRIGRLCIELDDVLSGS